MKKKRTLSLNSSAWKTLRAEVLASEPLCRMCAARGLVVPALTWTTSRTAARTTPTTTAG